MQSKIFSRTGLRFRNSRQKGTYNVSGTIDRKIECCGRKGLEVLLQRPQIDHIFLGCQKASRTPPAAQGKQALDVSSTVSMMVAEDDFRRGRDSGGAYLSKKLFGARDTAKHNRRGRHVGENQLTLHSPDGLLQKRRMIRR